jgi:hypothetical protein
MDVSITIKNLPPEMWTVLTAVISGTLGRSPSNIVEYDIEAALRKFEGTSLEIVLNGMKDIIVVSTYQGLDESKKLSLEANVSREGKN